MANRREWPCCHVFLFTLRNSRDKTASLLWTPFPLTGIFSPSELNTSFSRRAANCTMFLQGYGSYFPASTHLPPALLPVTSEDQSSDLRDALPATQGLLSRHPHITFCTNAPGWAWWLAPRKDLYLQPGREGRTQASWCRLSARRSQLPEPHETHVVGPKVVVVFCSVSVWSAQNSEQAVLQLPPVAVL